MKLFYKPISNMKIKCFYCVWWFEIQFRIGRSFKAPFNVRSSIHTLHLITIKYDIRKSFYSLLHMNLGLTKGTKGRKKHVTYKDFVKSSVIHLLNACYFSNVKSNKEASLFRVHGTTEIALDASIVKDFWTVWQTMTDPTTVCIAKIATPWNSGLKFDLPTWITK